MKNATVIVIGGGLSGLTTATYLASAGIDVLLLERGKRYAKRNINVPSEVLSGIGGAGTVSGGKLCFPPASGAIWRKTSKTMDRFHSFCQAMFSGLQVISPIPRQDNSLNSSMTRKYYRTEVVLKDSMQKFIVNLINQSTQNGVKIRSGCCVDGLRRTSNGYEVLFINEGGEREIQKSNYIVLATGRTSVAFLHTLFRLQQSHQPDLGIRLTTDLSQPLFSVIGEDVKLKQTIDRFMVRTFCVCCGGSSIKTSTDGYTHYDGHFESHLTDCTNFGILARSPLYSGIDISEHYLQSMQHYVDTAISLKDFIRLHALLSKGSIYDSLFDVLTEFILELYRSGMLNQNADEIPVLLPAVDRVNPFIHTNARFESSLPHVYVVGDAASISRGFVQAMWAGYCAAEGIISQITRTHYNLRKQVTAS